MWVGARILTVFIECGLKISNSCAGDLTKKYQRSNTNKQVLKGTVILLAYCYDRVCLNGCLFGPQINATIG